MKWGLVTPAGHAVLQAYRQGMGRELGDLDVAAVKQVLEKLSDGD